MSCLGSVWSPAPKRAHSSGPHRGSVAPAVSAPGTYSPTVEFRAEVLQDLSELFLVYKLPDQPDWDKNRRLEMRRSSGCVWACWAQLPVPVEYAYIGKVHEHHWWDAAPPRNRSSPGVCPSNDIVQFETVFGEGGHPASSFWAVLDSLPPVQTVRTTTCHSPAFIDDRTPSAGQANVPIIHGPPPLGEAAVADMIERRLAAHSKLLEANMTRQIQATMDQKLREKDVALEARLRTTGLSAISSAAVADMIEKRLADHSKLLEANITRQFLAAMDSKLAEKDSELDGRIQSVFQQASLSAISTVGARESRASSSWNPWPLLTEVDERTKELEDCLRGHTTNLQGITMKLDPALARQQEMTEEVRHIGNLRQDLKDNERLLRQLQESVRGLEAVKEQVGQLNLVREDLKEVEFGLRRLKADVKSLKELPEAPVDEQARPSDPEVPSNDESQQPPHELPPPTSALSPRPTPTPTASSDDRVQEPHKNEEQVAAPAPAPDFDERGQTLPTTAAAAAAPTAETVRPTMVSAFASASAERSSTATTTATTRTTRTWNVATPPVSSTSTTATAVSAAMPPTQTPTTTGAATVTEPAAAAAAAAPAPAAVPPTAPRSPQTTARVHTSPASLSAAQSWAASGKTLDAFAPPAAAYFEVHHGLDSDQAQAAVRLCRKVLDGLCAEQMKFLKHEGERPGTKAIKASYLSLHSDKILGEEQDKQVGDAALIWYRNIWERDHKSGYLKLSAS